MSACLLKKFIESEKAVSPIVGMIIILAMTITSVSVIFLYGVPTIYEMQDMANAQKVEQAFTVFDSRTSKVALGESPSQTTSFSMMDGDIIVKGDNASYEESRIVIISVDINASWYDGFKQQRYRWKGWEDYVGNESMNEFNASMGSIVYTNNDRIIGYEGGGVWSKYPNGKSVMISPPEFHYNGETLTLPIMKIEGDAVYSGKSDVRITISSDNLPAVLYPNPSSDSRRTNPLTSDKVMIYIKSEFYNAWADYANSLAYASAETDDANQTAIVELEVIPAMGKDTLKTAFKIGSVNQDNSTPMGKFSFDLEARASQGLNPSNYQITATSGTRTLTYTLAKKGGNDQLEIGLIYEDVAPGGGIETWEGDGEFDVSGANEEQSATVDLLSTTMTMKYDAKDGEEFSWGNNTSISITPDVDYSNDAPESLFILTQHYMKLLTMEGSVVFNLIQPGNSDPVDYDESSLTLYYDGMPGSITYLHVSRNDLTATLN
ncbi:archaellin/type IV pilin N-terminal domain-containing protein [Methanolobus mangrovi]|uniref:Archaellin/type IV pilin N-terminal domain-containing protein n=1 Tax=Methanolobus mangrovi TaxID=3072977 RepID=A0AA51UEC3_9EURY|nr:archaellin/type IV pilin N-terminal domain-containing protein [Methanolobus mangrovi]WMW21553.1 archaellin/type IV pilin N-terminal domain-containing protein [Methanolobus mangrovi]